MIRRAAVAAGFAALLALVACDDDGARSVATTTTVAATAASLCPVVRAWSDQSADALEAFRLASRGLSVAARRQRYAQAFQDQAQIRDRFAAALGKLQLPGDVRASMDAAAREVGAIISGGARDAAALPDAAYQYVAVGDGTLYTGTEKARAVVFQALTDLAHSKAADVPRGCGQRGPLDLSPSATFPP